MEVIVLDNNSEDGSPDMVEREFPWVRLMRMSANLGFTKGQNEMLRNRRGRHALLLNSDTIVYEGALGKLMTHLEAHPEIGILGPKLENPDGSLQFSCRRFPNPVAAMFRNTPLGRLFPNNRYTREYLMQDFDHSETREVDWLSGAAMLVRDELMEKIGYLDEQFFMYDEDVDLCFRTWKAGYKVVYMPNAIIMHRVGRSTDKAPNRMIGRFHRSTFQFYRKNMLPEVAVPLRPFALVAAAGALTLRASYFILRNKMDDIKRRAQR